MLKTNQDDCLKGDWCFINDDTYIFIQYGDDNFKEVCIIPIAINPTEKRQWKWNGNRELPTLTPSILVHPVKDWTIGWHGFLTDGKLVTV